MGFYGERILPHVIDYVCGAGDVKKQRARIVPLATGRVLEVGMGSGLNLPFYDPSQVELVWGLEPSEGMRRKAAPRLADSELDVRWLGLPGEEIPLDDDSVDTIVLTYTLCSIPDWRTALDQMRRVLRSDGKVVFSEHGEAPDEAVQKWQRRINPAWKVVAGGCNINRPIVDCLEQTGFSVDEIRAEYRGAPKVATFTSTGIATLA